MSECVGNFQCYIIPFVTPSVAFVIGVLPHWLNRYKTKQDFQKNIDTLLAEGATYDAMFTDNLSLYFKCDTYSSENEKRELFFKFQTYGRGMECCVLKLAGYYTNGLIPKNYKKGIESSIVKHWDEIIPKYAKVLDLMSRRLGPGTVKFDEKDYAVIKIAYSFIKQSDAPSLWRRMLWFGQKVPSFFLATLHFSLALFVVYLTTLLF